MEVHQLQFGRFAVCCYLPLIIQECTTMGQTCSLLSYSTHRLISFYLPALCLSLVSTPGILHTPERRAMNDHNALPLHHHPIMYVSHHHPYVNGRLFIIMYYVYACTLSICSGTLHHLVPLMTMILLSQLACNLSVNG